jgi:type VI secretion system secreted protein Hcp
MFAKITLALFLCLLAIAPGQAAMDMFLKVDNVPGESLDKSNAGAIDVLAWSWGMSNPGSIVTGGGSGAGKVNIQDLSLTKYVDKASPLLMLGCSKGTHYPTAVLTLRKAGSTPVVFMKITMKEVMVTSLSTGGSGGEDRFTENVTLTFAEVLVEYWQQKPDGTVVTTPVSYGWNIAENVEN